MKEVFNLLKSVCILALVFLLLATAARFLPGSNPDFKLFMSLVSLKTGTHLAGLVIGGILFFLLLRQVRISRFQFDSLVEKHQGPCLPIWVNKNQIDYMLTGAVTGFFRRAYSIKGIPLAILVGPEFHGYVRDNKVHTTFGFYGRVPN